MKAVLLDRANEKEINEFNVQMGQWINLYYPENKKSKEDEVGELVETFKILFRDQDGKPKTISMEAGEVNPNIEVDSYLKTIKNSKT